MYLQAPVDVLLERIAKRGIDYEQYIERQYLERLNEAYARFFHEFEAAPLLIVNAASIDPISQPARLRRAAGGDQAHEPRAALLQPVAQPRALATLAPMYTHLQRDASRPPVTLTTLARMKADGEKIACLTCYDASFAVLLDAADVDVVLVGDSLGMVIQGHDTTVPVTMDQMVYHSRRGGARPASPVPDHRSAVHELPVAGPGAGATRVRLMQEGGAQMVKLESGGKQTEIVEFLTGHDIAVCAHLGLKPQSVHKTGGFRVQGRERDTAARAAGGGAAAGGGGRGHRAARVHPGRRWARQITAGAARAGDRHRRRPGYRRPDPRALRHARHHHRAQAALRAQLHGRRGATTSRPLQALRARGRSRASIPRPSTASSQRWRPSPPSPPCASACAAGAAKGARVAFVPTMGNLHAGHVSLIEAAREHGERFVASIFVNPMQFGPNEDFAHYPRTPREDERMLAAAGCDLMFMPDVAEIYPARRRARHARRGAGPVAHPATASSAPATSRA